MIRNIIKSDYQNAFTAEEPDKVLNADSTITHIVSQEVLTKDWLNPEEDLAWHDL